MAIEIDEKLLNDAERSKLHSMQKAASGKATALEWAEAFGVTTGPGQVRRRPATVVLAIAFVVGVVWVVLRVMAEPSTPTPFVGMLAFFALFWVAFLVDLWMREANAWAGKQIQPYLDSIGYPERVASRRRSAGERDSDDVGFPLSKRQQRAQWYNENGPHPNLDHHDYELAHDIYGMSADEWESNRPD